MTKFLLVAALAAGLLMAGCAADNGLETASLAARPIPAGKARVTINRESTIVYSGVPASITLNGKEVASIAAGGAAVFDVPAGDSEISASAWSYPGSFKVKLHAKAGERYAFEVGPRSASFGPNMLGPIGGAIDASVNENAGAFELKPTAAKQAQKSG